jgi:hypothetical protein
MLERTIATYCEMTEDARTAALECQERVKSILLATRGKGFSTTALAWAMLGALSNITRQVLQRADTQSQARQARSRQIHGKSDHGAEQGPPNSPQLIDHLKRLTVSAARAGGRGETGPLRRPERIRAAPVATPAEYPERRAEVSANGLSKG